MKKYRRFKTAWQYFLSEDGFIGRFNKKTNETQVVLAGGVTWVSLGRKKVNHV